MKSFKVQVDDWVKQSTARVEAVVKQSASDIIGIMQTPVAKGGNMPVKTGFLRNSLAVTLGSPSNSIQFNNGNGGGLVQPYELAVAGFEAGDTIHGVYTANYAGYVHYGVGGRAGRLWVDLAAQRWQSVVLGNVAKLKSSAAFR